MLVSEDFQVGLGRVGVVSRFRLKYQEFLQQLLWLNFRYWVFFQVGLGFDSGFGFQIFVFCFSLGFKVGLRGLIGVFSRVHEF